VSRWPLIVLVLVGVVMVVVGAGLEWSRVTLDGREISTESGLSRGDGSLTAALAAVAGLAGAAWAGWGRARRAALVTLAAGAGIVLVAVLAMVDVRDQPARIAREVTGFLPRVESVVSPGLWLTLAGGALLVIGGGLAAARRPGTAR
jgi:hypothetical protein